MEIESDPAKTQNLAVIQLQIAQAILLHMMHDQRGGKGGEVFEVLQKAIDLLNSLPSEH